jgi:long-chain acyl-CoA synthetase
MDEALRRMVEQQPDHAAIVDNETVISYADLDARIAEAAAALERAGVRPGHAVGLHLGSGLDYIVHNYAIWRLRAITVPIATELALDEKDEVCRNIALDSVISQPGPLKFATEWIASESISLSSRAGLTRINSPIEHPAGFANINAAFIRFTSGTTGQSKGVVLSHESIHERIHAANQVLQLGPDDRVMWLLSMSYHFTVSIVAYLTFGATIVLPRNNLAAAVVESCERNQATFLYGSPIHCALMADFPGGKPIPSLHTVISTTTALDLGVASRFFDRYDVPISQALGLIELGLPCINLRFARTKHDSVGEVLPAYEVRLEDVGFGPGMKEIFFRGPGALDAYYRPFRTRDEIMPNGWFATHDVGMLDEDGCLFLRGRSKEVISVMGMKFFPQEVENVLVQHPAVKEASVYGVAHERTGEVARARVVLRVAGSTDELQNELRRYCLEHLAPYKVPEQIEFVKALPKTASGKVLHRVTPSASTAPPRPELQEVLEHSAAMPGSEELPGGFPPSNGH